MKETRREHSGSKRGLSTGNDWVVGRGEGRNVGTMELHRALKVRVKSLNFMQENEIQLSDLRKGMVVGT